MKVSDLIEQLESYKTIFGDDEVEFWVSRAWGESEEVYLRKIHDGYSSEERECELWLEY